MTLEEFKHMDIHEKVKYINKQLAKGLIRSEIYKKIGIPKSTIQTQLHKEYIFNYTLNKYIHKDDNSMTDVTTQMSTGRQIISNVTTIPEKKIEEDIELVDDKGMTISIQQELKNNIFSLANDYNKIQDMLKWFETKDDKGMTEVIEVINEGIKINLPSGEVIRTTIRINKEIWDRFDEFSKINKQFNKQDLMAQALKEYMDKY